MFHHGIFWLLEITFKLHLVPTEFKLFWTGWFEFSDNLWIILWRKEIIIGHFLQVLVVLYWSRWLNTNFGRITTSQTTLHLTPSLVELLTQLKNNQWCSITAQDGVQISPSLIKLIYPFHSHYQLNVQQLGLVVHTFEYEVLSSICNLLTTPWKVCLIDFAVQSQSRIWTVPEESEIKP